MAAPKKKAKVKEEAQTDALVMYGKKIPEQVPTGLKYFCNSEHPSESLPAHFLAWLLTQVDPKFYTTHSLSSLKPSARASVPIVKLQQLFEHNFSITPSMTITEEARETANMVTMLKDIYFQADLPGRQLGLPPKFDEDGWYTVEHEKESLEHEVPSYCTIVTT